jgi:phosphoribosylformylglycinamidine cyclo-ligase
VLGPHREHEGDVLIGLGSTGLHANGYSLVRSSLLDRYELSDTPEGLDRPLADELLEPCAIVAPAILGLARDGLLHATAHITGGGIYENLPRVLPPGLGAVVRRGTWPEPAIFGLVQRASGADDDEMFWTFNMGIGTVIVAAPDAAQEILHRNVSRAYRIGEVTPGVGVRIARP